MKQTKLIAVGAVLCAVGVVLLYLGSVSQVLDLSCAALASILVTYAVIEMRGIWPYLVYIVTSLLSLLLLPDKFGAVVYTVFAGYYPIVKYYVEKMMHGVAEWAVKLILFNAALTGVILISKKVLMMPDDEIAFKWIVYLVCNVVFILFDIALTRLITLYLVKFRKRFKLK